MATKKSRPTLISRIAAPAAQGTIAKARSMEPAAATGASTKSTRSAKGGIQSSFANSLIMSATAWSTPQGPTRFGPGRSCRKPSSRRSHQVRSAAPSRVPTRTGSTSA